MRYTLMLPLGMQDVYRSFFSRAKAAELAGNSHGSDVQDFADLAAVCNRKITEAEVESSRLAGVLRPMVLLSRNRIHVHGFIKGEMIVVVRIASQSPANLEELYRLFLDLTQSEKGLDVLAFIGIPTAVLSSPTALLQ